MVKLYTFVSRMMLAVKQSAYHISNRGVFDE